MYAVDRGNQTGSTIFIIQGDDTIIGSIEFGHVSVTQSRTSRECWYKHGRPGTDTKSSRHATLGKIKFIA